MATRLGLPVRKGRLPVIGHIIPLYMDNERALREARAALGDAFWINVGFGNWMLILCGEKNFARLTDPALSNSFLAQDLPSLVGTSVFGQDGQAHKRSRHLLGPEFSPGGIARHKIGEVTGQIIRDRLAGWSNKDIDLRKETQELALDIIFGILGCEKSELPMWRKKYRELSLDAYRVPILLPGFPKYRAQRAAEWTRNRLRNIAAKLDKDNRQLLGTLLDVSRREPEGLTEKQVLDNAQFIGFAGHETTASILVWLSLILASRPDLWSALTEEVARLAVFPTTFEVLKKFRFAEALFRETLYHFPPLNLVARRVAGPFEVDGHVLPLETIVGIDVALKQRVDFDPKYWLDKTGSPTATELSQFGGGAHFCLGYHLAWLEGVQFLVALAQTGTAWNRSPKMDASTLPRLVYRPLGRADHVPLFSLQTN